MVYLDGERPVHVPRSPEPYQSATGSWWYCRTYPTTGSFAPHGPFYTREEAVAEIKDDAARTEHAMPIPVTLQRTPLGDAVVATAKAAHAEWDVTSDPDVAMGALSPLNYTATDEVDRLIHHIRDTGYTLNEATYSVKLAAGLDAEHDWATGLIEISYTELQAIQAILALRR